MLISPELLRIVLAGLAELVRRVVARQGEVSAAPPILFRDHIVSETAHMWDRRIREATRQTADTDRHHQAEQQARGMRAVMSNGQGRCGLDRGR